MPHPPSEERVRPAVARRTLRSTGQRPGAAMKRDEWFMALATRVLEALSDEYRCEARAIGAAYVPADSSAPAAETRDDIVPAMIVAEIARRYAAAEHPDDIVSWLAGFVASNS